MVLDQRVADRPQVTGTLCITQGLALSPVGHIPLLECGVLKAAEGAEPDVELGRLRTGQVEPELVAQHIYGPFRAMRSVCL